MRSPDKIGDEELVTLCKSGHAIGYTGLYNKYAKAVYNTIHRLVLHTGEAEDILQEAFIAVFQQIEDYQPDSSFAAWVKRVAVNKSISWLRKNKVRLVEKQEHEIADETEEIMDEDWFHYQVEEVKKSIEQLSPGYRTIVNLYLLENMPQEEIGQLLGISHATVRSQYHRARKKMALILKQKEVV